MLTELTVDENKCIHCRQCLNFCYFNALGWDMENDRPYIENQPSCQMCYICQDGCPMHAITLVKRQSFE